MSTTKTLQELAAEEILASTEIELLSFPSHESALAKLIAIIASYFPDSTSPQVDTTLEALAEQAALKLRLLPVGALNAERYQIVLDTLLSAHARQPTQGVNERLLKAAKRAAQNLSPHCGDKTKAAYELDEAIRAAESAAVPNESMEKELAEALSLLIAVHSPQCETAKLVEHQARAILARFDARKTEGGK